MTPALLVVLYLALITLVLLLAPVPGLAAAFAGPLTAHGITAG